MHLQAMPLKLLPWKPSIETSLFQFLHLDICFEMENRIRFNIKCLAFKLLPTF